MLATLGGSLALVLGLFILVLPLLVTELSRPRDSVWGAVVLLLGLVLVTSADRLTGAPMLAVLCGGLLVGRLGSEVAQGRWRLLSDEERRALLSSERWSRSVAQIGASAASLLEAGLGLVAGVAAWQAERTQGRSRARGKRWVRAESSEAVAADGPAPDAPLADAASSAAAPAAAAADQVPEARELSSEVALPQEAAEPSPVPEDGPAVEAARGEAAPEPTDVRIVSDFSGIDALLEAAEPAAAEPAASEPAAAAGTGVPSSSGVAGFAARLDDEASTGEPQPRPDSALLSPDGGD